MRLSLLASAFAIVAAAPAPALAQRAPDRTVTFGAYGGSTHSVSSSNTPSIFSAGMHAGALAEFRTPWRWLAFRVDGSYQRLDAGSQDITDGNGRMIAQLFMQTSRVTASANAVARIPGLRTAVQPYAIVGVTTFRTEAHVSQTSGLPLGPLGPAEVVRTNGANVGLGLDAPLGRTLLFVEARYARMGPVLGHVPISLGVKFR